MFRSMTKWALITGASSGIGQAFVEVLASEGYGIMGVARDERRLSDVLQKAREGHGVDVLPFALDISKDGCVELVLDRATSTGDVEVVVNNAGIGFYGPMHESDPDTVDLVVKTNVLAATKIAHLFGAYMASRGHGTLINVSSTAAMMPGPYSAPYFASKAYILSLSLALHHELRRFGVKVIALCPGPTDTRFFERCGMETARIAHMRRGPPVRVAEVGWRAARKGRRVVVPGILNHLTYRIAPYVPQFIMMRVVSYLLRSPRHQYRSM